MPHNEEAYNSAIEQLLAEGFTHIVMHHREYGDQSLNHTFAHLPAAYDDGYVSIYRLRDLGGSCQSDYIEPARFRRLAESALATPGPRSSIASFHTSDSMSADRLSYLGSLFSDWSSLVHLYHENGALIIRSAGKPYPDLDAFAKESQLVTLIYDADDSASAPGAVLRSLERFHRCQRASHEDGSIIERYVKREFSCQLVAAVEPLRVDYDNGATLENVHFELA